MNLLNQLSPSRTFIETASSSNKLEKPNNDDFLILDYDENLDDFQNISDLTNESFQANPEKKILCTKIVNYLKEVIKSPSNASDVGGILKAIFIALKKMNALAANCKNDQLQYYGNEEIAKHYFAQFMNDSNSELYQDLNNICSHRGSISSYMATTASLIGKYTNVNMLSDYTPTKTSQALANKILALAVSHNIMAKPNTLSLLEDANSNLVFADKLFSNIFSPKDIVAAISNPTLFITEKAFNQKSQTHVEQDFVMVQAVLTKNILNLKSEIVTMMDVKEVISDLGKLIINLNNTMERLDKVLNAVKGDPCLRIVEGSAIESRNFIHRLLPKFITAISGYENTLLEYEKESNPQQEISPIIAYNPPLVASLAQNKLGL